eukprot:m.713295 g.713295  ORF g.713295 m.713295 type:complete len:69 (+) comp22971_c1_seq6:3023-3229(+)
MGRTLDGDPRLRATELLLQCGGVRDRGLRVVVTSTNGVDTLQGHVGVLLPNSCNRNSAISSFPLHAHP